MNFFNKVSILCSLFILSICPYVSVQACGVINPCKAEIDDEGNIFMVWHENVNNRSVVKAKQKFVNGDWSESVKISDDEFSAHNPIVKTDGKGNAVALWMGFSENCSGSALFGCTILFLFAAYLLLKILKLQTYQNNNCIEYFHPYLELFLLKIL